MIFDKEIDHLTSRHVSVTASPQNNSFANLDDIVAQGQQLHHDLKVLSLDWDEDEPKVSLNLAPGFRIKPGDVSVLSFDTHSVKLLEEQDSSGSFMDVVTRLVKLEELASEELPTGILAK